MSPLPDFDARLDDPLSMREGVRESIQTFGLHRAEDGERIFSSKGGSLAWLIDLRQVFLHRPTLETIARLFWARFENYPPFQIGGMETAAIPLLTALLMTTPPSRSEVNGFIVRKERKTSGLGRAIEGTVTQEPIILVDDILNSGRSAEKARAVIEQEGHKIFEVFAVIDYGAPKGLRWRKDNEVPVRSLFALGDFGLHLNAPAAPSQRQGAYNEIWRVAIPGGNPSYVVPKSAPLYWSGSVFRGCDAGTMHCFDAATGAISWAYQTKGTSKRKGIWSSPTIDDGRLYFGAYNGVCYCLDAMSGEEIWQTGHCEWIGASPIVVRKHGLLYIGLEYERPWAKGGLAAIRTSDGQKVWEHIVKKYQHGSPAYWEKGDLVIWGTADHEMKALDAKTGRPAWSFKTRRSVKYAPAVDQTRDLVAFASFDNSIYLLDAATGEKRGEWETEGLCYTTPLILGNRLFCGSSDRHLYVIDLTTLELVKKIETKARIFSSPKAIGQKIVFGTCGGQLIELDSETLSVENIVQLPDAITNAICLSDDNKRIFVSTYMNYLLGIERQSGSES